MTLKNTDKSYIIDVVNEQTLDGERSVIRETAEGRLSARGNKRYITYRGVTDGEKYSTVIIVEDGRVSVKREGYTSSRILCDTSRRTLSRHITPYGTFCADVETEVISAELDDNGGALVLKYVSTIQEQKFENNMIIKVEEKP